jgi:hypothetical protein
VLRLQGRKLLLIMLLLLQAVRSHQPCCRCPLWHLQQQQRRVLLLVGLERAVL